MSGDYIDAIGTFLLGAHKVLLPTVGFVARVRVLSGYDLVY